MPDSLEVSTILPADPRRIYAAWLSGDEHGAMTGGSAEVDPRVGGPFSAWDGYITGTTLELKPYSRIVQAWRTTDFPADSPDSRLEVLLEETPGGTKLTLKHSQLPDGQGHGYEVGWADNYFEPMKTYFKEQL
jgi:uncharacterized protein YndB with AHSA1/START domain